MALDGNLKTWDGTQWIETVRDIPDSGLDHLWWGPSIDDISTFPDEEGVLDLSADGGPVLSDINGRQASSYDGVDDGHRTTTGLSLGSGGVWTAVLVVEPNDNNETVVAFSTGTDGSNAGGYALRIRWDNNDYAVTHSGIVSADAGTPTTDPQVIVATFDGSNAIMDVNGDEVVNESISPPDPVQDATAIGQRSDQTRHLDGVVGAAGHEAAAADANRRDELTEMFGDEFGIPVSV